MGVASWFSGTSDRGCGRNRGQSALPKVYSDPRSRSRDPWGQRRPYVRYRTDSSKCMN